MTGTPVFSFFLLFNVPFFFYDFDLGVPCILSVGWIPYVRYQTLSSFLCETLVHLSIDRNMIIFQESAQAVNVRVFHFQYELFIELI